MSVGDLENGGRWVVFGECGQLSAKDLERLIAWLKKAQKHCKKMNRTPKTIKNRQP